MVWTPEACTLLEDKLVERPTLPGFDSVYLLSNVIPKKLLFTSFISKEKKIESYLYILYLHI